MTKKQRVNGIIAALAKEYLGAKCSLDFENAWELMVSVRLAAQCTDARVNIVTKELFKIYPNAKALADADASAVEEIVRPCGLGKTKARDICAAMHKLVYEYDNKMPDTIEELLKFPGVGRKSANLIVGDVFGKPAIVCDTHCIRLSNRMGLAEGTNPASVEKQLREIVPPHEGNDLCHRFVLHGRAVCSARSYAAAETFAGHMRAHENSSICSRRLF